MSYPPPRYHGDTGEISASFRRAEHLPELTYPSGGTVHYLATGGSTGGEFGLYRWDFAPTGGGPDPHFREPSSSQSLAALGLWADPRGPMSGAEHSRPRRGLVVLVPDLLAEGEPAGPAGRRPVRVHLSRPSVRRQCCCWSNRAPHAEVCAFESLADGDDRSS